ncbi:MAG: single-stranded-DNA-specific exonuclease RecJ [Gammaproteobacteria bacterium]|nr:MAG: single-stranded-DNA-specific exonuclease RecJ [Gammaproteobacteria bacterium]
MVAQARAFSPHLLVTVDNGISSVEGVEAAHEAGMRVVITDHHLPGATLPPADAIVNPNVPGCDFPWKCTAGVGVMFYVLSVLRRVLVERGWSQAGQVKLADWLDLVAVGTVADLVPLKYNNRILVSAGLARMRAGRLRPGLRALLKVAGRDVASLSSQDLAFAVAPRLNAAGRLENMAQGVECLLAPDAASARAHAESLDALNRQRREIEQDMRDQAEAAVRNLHLNGRGLPSGVCLFDESWHEGVIGIVASRIKERVHRPVVVLAPGENGLVKGSGRSVSGFHLRDALDEVATRHPGLLTKFGGHAMAAGLTLPRENLETFSQAFAAVARDKLGDVPPGLVVESDGELRAEDMSLANAVALEEAGPWGQGFPEPLFDGWFELLAHRRVGQNHLKMTLLHEGHDQPQDAILFNFDQWEALHRVRRVHLAYQLDVNRYQGRMRLQLLVRHWLAHE